MQRRDLAHRQQGAFDFDAPPEQVRVRTHSTARLPETRDRLRVVLEALKSGPKTTNDFLDISTHRFSTLINELKDRGHDIRKVQLSPSQWMYSWHGCTPTKKLRKGMKEAYYESPYWRSVRAERLQVDGHVCARCKAESDLQVHHWRYDLFRERIHDLQTFCRGCHGWLHEHECVRASFPKWVSDEVYSRLEQLTGGKRCS